MQLWSLWCVKFCLCSSYSLGYVWLHTISFGFIKPIIWCLVCIIILFNLVWAILAFDAWDELFYLHELFFSPYEVSVKWKEFTVLCLTVSCHLPLNVPAVRSILGIHSWIFFPSYPKFSFPICYYSSSSHVTSVGLWNPMQWAFGHARNPGNHEGSRRNGDSQPHRTTDCGHRPWHHEVVGVMKCESRVRLMEPNRWDRRE